MNEIKRIGLFGFGTVGQAFYELLQEQPELGYSIRRVVVKQIGKQRELPSALLSYQAQDILEDPDIDVVVELIDDAEAAYAIAQRALQAGKPLISANKKMIATNLSELIGLQRVYQTPFRYEASVGGGMPLLRTLEDSFAGEAITGFEGILNGSSNYILSQMRERGSGYHAVLQEAQRLGYAESDPAMDVEGYDATFKLIITLAHTLGYIADFSQIPRFGISAISPADLAWAEQKGARWKLVAKAALGPENKPYAWVMPTLVNKEERLFGVEESFNALSWRGCYSGTHLLQGLGAGGKPTASAVLADLIALKQGQAYQYPKLRLRPVKRLASPSVELPVYVRAKNKNELSRLGLSENQGQWQGKMGLAELLDLQERANRADVFLGATGPEQITQHATETLRTPALAI